MQYFILAKIYTPKVDVWQEPKYASDVQPSKNIKVLDFWDS